MMANLPFGILEQLKSSVFAQLPAKGENVTIPVKPEILSTTSITQWCPMSDFAEYVHQQKKSTVYLERGKTRKVVDASVSTFPYMVQKRASK